MTEKSKDHLDSIFDEHSLDITLKKAKRVTLFRTISISAIVCILIVFGVYRANLWLLGKKGDETAAKLIAQDAIMKAPNTIVNTETLDIGFLKGSIKREVYKVVEDKIIPWETQEAHFGLRGFESISFSSYSTLIDENTRLHIPNGEKEMLFYVPQYNYQNYSNDLLKLNEYPSDKYIELAISFDKSYSLNEVREMLPKSVHQTWYWVNNYSNKHANRGEPESGQWIYGISNPSSKLGEAFGSEPLKNESEFLSRLKKFNKVDYTRLKKRKEEGLIIGVVVTGTKDDILLLKSQQYVKATSIGAVVEKY